MNSQCPKCGEMVLPDLAENGSGGLYACRCGATWGSWRSGWTTILVGFDASKLKVSCAE